MRQFNNPVIAPACDYWHCDDYKYGTESNTTTGCQLHTIGDRANASRSFILNSDVTK